MKRKIFPGFLIILTFLLLLGFPALSLEGARRGLRLWYETVLPTLLPFMICMNLLVSTGTAKLLTAPLCPFTRRFLGLSDTGSFVLLSGILCGYPMGAKNCSDFLDRQEISPAEARTLYAVSSFPSPMFLAGYMMNMANAGQTPLIPPLPLWKMAAAVYLPAVPLFFLASRCYRKNILRRMQSCSFLCSAGSPGSLSCSSPAFCADIQPSSSIDTPLLSSAEIQPSFSLDEALLSSIEVMVKIGGYLMLFSILAAFIRRLPLPGTILPALLIAIAEMTTGIEHASLSFSGLTKLLLIVFSGAFGGLSGAFQVRSVTKNAGLSIRHYLFWKTAHGLLAAFTLAVLAARH